MIVRAIVSLILISLIANCNSKLFPKDVHSDHLLPKALSHAITQTPIHKCKTFVLIHDGGFLHAEMDEIISVMSMSSPDELSTLTLGKLTDNLHGYNDKLLD